MRKFPRCAEVGVRHAWLIDPVAQTLAVYRLLDEGGYELALTAAGVRAEPFDAIELDRRVLWDLAT